jgi:hypothetical protein
MFKNLFSRDKKNEPRAVITLVSGLPRSGTSMMMKMLVAGGMQALTDQVRQPDPDNPEGYFEFEPVKQLKDGDTTWLPQARGKVVKVIATLLPYLPPDFHYKVVFMLRAMPEILASQRKMLISRGKDPDAVSDEEINRLFTLHLQQVAGWMAKQANLDYLEVSYNQMLENPEPLVDKLNQFLDGKLDTDKMRQVINPALYRQRYPGRD